MRNELLLPIIVVVVVLSGVILLFSGGGDNSPSEITTPTPTPIPTTVPTTIPTTVPTTIPTPVPTTVPTTIPTTIPTPVPTQASEFRTDIISGFSDIAPLYSQLRENVHLADYYRVDSYSRDLVRTTNAEMARIGYNPDSPNVRNPFSDGLSSTDKVLYNKYAAWLGHIRDVGENAQGAMFLRRENYLDFSRMSRDEIFYSTLDASNKAVTELNSLFDSCNLYKIDCGENSANANALKRRFTVR